jgi:hypothetical protein
MAPLVYFYQERRRCHGGRCPATDGHDPPNPDVIDSAAYFARVTAAVLQGQEPIDALQDVARRGFDRHPFKRWVSEGLGSRALDTRQAIGQFGQACDVSAGIPGCGPFDYQISG